MRVCVCVLSGLPASGKSSVARAVRERLLCPAHSLALAHCEAESQSLSKSRAHSLALTQSVAQSESVCESLCEYQAHSECQCESRCDPASHCVRESDDLSLHVLILEYDTLIPITIFEKGHQHIDTGHLDIDNTHQHIDKTHQDIDTRHLETGRRTENVEETSQDLIDDDDVAGGEHERRWKTLRRSVLTCLRLWLTQPHALTMPPEWRGGDEALVWEAFLTQLRDQGFTTAGMESVNPGIVILLDDNFYYRSMRYEVFQLVRDVCGGFCQVHVTCPPPLCEARNPRRPHPVPRGVIRVMSSRLQPPPAARGGRGWERRSHVMRSPGDRWERDVDDICGMIMEALNDPEQPPQAPDPQITESARVLCRKAVSHRADSALRRCVSRAMTRLPESLSKDERRSVAERLNLLRISILKRGGGGAGGGHTWDSVEAAIECVEHEFETGFSSLLAQL